MISEITPEGLFLPAELFGPAKRVEIHREKNRLIVTPLEESDPLDDLGTDPEPCGLSDASEEHDKYLYGDQK